MDTVIDQKMPRSTHSLAGLKNIASGRRKPEARSRVSNGSCILPNIDGRSVIARRYQDIVEAILVDQGGSDQCSEARLQLVRRFAAAAVLAEQMEAALAQGQQVNITEHALLCSTLVRVGQRIGIDQIPRNVTPSVQDYLAAVRARDDEEGL
jgi:hypothetical protein